MDMSNQKQKYFAAFAIGAILAGSLALEQLAAIDARAAAVPGDCWFIMLTNASSLVSKVHVWNLTEPEFGMGSCDLLKSLCYTIQINYNIANSTDYNCRWHAASNMYGNSSCVCGWAPYRGAFSAPD